MDEELLRRELTGAGNSGSRGSSGRMPSLMAHMPAGSRQPMIVRLDPSTGAPVTGLRAPTGASAGGKQQPPMMFYAPDNVPMSDLKETLSSGDLAELLRGGGGRPAGERPGSKPTIFIAPQQMLSRDRSQMPQERSTTEGKASAEPEIDLDTLLKLLALGAPPQRESQTPEQSYLGFLPQQQQQQAMYGYPPPTVAPHGAAHPPPYPTMMPPLHAYPPPHPYYAPPPPPPPPALAPYQSYMPLWAAPQASLNAMPYPSSVHPSPPVAAEGGVMPMHSSLPCRCDVRENDKVYMITCEMPGCTRDDIMVEMRGNTLTLTGKVAEDQPLENERRHYCERAYGEFVRTFYLADDADVENLRADLRNGVLRLEIPRKPQRPPRKIDLPAAETVTEQPIIQKA